MILLLFCYIFLNALVAGSKICKTQTCISVSDEILQFMDTTADPCEDFNQFACGGYLKTADYDANTWSEAAKQMQKRIKRLIKATKKQEGDFEVDQKVRNFYNACKKFSSHLGVHKEEAKDRYLAKLVKQTLTNVGLKDWPFSGKSTLPHNSEWFNVVPKIVKEGLSYTDGRIELPIFNVDVGVNDLTRNEYALKIDSPDYDEWDGSNWDEEWEGFGLQDLDYYMELHFNRTTSLLKYINTDSNISIPINQLLNRSIEIDDALYSISSYVDDRFYKAARDYGLGYKEYKQTTISELLPIPCGTTGSGCKPPTWITFIDSVFQASGNKNVEIKSNQTVLIKDPEYFDQLDATLETLQIKPYEMANYIGWKVLVDSVLAARNLASAFKGDCIKYLIAGYDNNEYAENGLLNIAVGSMYARNYFNVGKKKDVLTMVKYIRKTFELLVSRIDWMDEETITKAVEKLQAMGESVAYPDALLDRKTMDQYYKGLCFSKS
jgi:hypothetical protein